MQISDILQMIMNMKWAKMFLLTAAVSLTGGMAFGQVTTADVVGSVTDPQGARVPRATVTITNADPQVLRKVTASDSGEYTITQHQPGPYSVVVEMKGFKSSRSADLPLAAVDRTRVDAKLELGSTSETVEVTGARPLLQADSSSVSSVAPRVGFAQTLPGEAVLRGGFSISYYPVQTTSTMQNINPPELYTITNCKYPCNGLSWPNVRFRSLAARRT